MISDIQEEQIRRLALDEIAQSMQPWGNKEPFKDWDDFQRRDKMSFKKQFIRIAVDITLRKVKKVLR